MSIRLESSVLFHLMILGTEVGWERVTSGNSDLLERAAGSKTLAARPSQNAKHRKTYANERRGGVRERSQLDAQFMAAQVVPSACKLTLGAIGAVRNGRLIS